MVAGNPLAACRAIIADSDAALNPPYVALPSELVGMSSVHGNLPTSDWS